MKGKMTKLITTTLLVVSMSIAAVGCGTGTTNDKKSTSSGTTVTKKLSGDLTLAGSTALQPLAEQAGKVFMDKYNDVTVTVQGGGSGQGLNLVSEGTVNIGNSDVPAEEKLDKDKAKNLVDNKVCVIGFAMVTSKDVKVDSLTKQQIQDIFTGKVTNWKQVGGNDEAINVVNRTKSSGTRATFKDTIMESADEKEGLGTLQDASGSAEKALESNKGSITYLALSYLTSDIKDKVNVVKIDGIESSKENIISGKYPFWSYEHMYTNGKPSELAKAFIDYMTSSENKSLTEKLGYIIMSDMKVKK